MESPQKAPQWTNFCHKHGGTFQSSSAVDIICPAYAASREAKATYEAWKQADELALHTHAAPAISAHRTAAFQEWMRAETAWIDQCRANREANFLPVVTSERAGYHPDLTSSVCGS